MGGGRSPPHAIQRVRWGLRVTDKMGAKVRRLPLLYSPSESSTFFFFFFYNSPLSRSLSRAMKLACTLGSSILPLQIIDRSSGMVTFKTSIVPRASSLSLSPGRSASELPTTKNGQKRLAHHLASGIPAESGFGNRSFSSSMSGSRHSQSPPSSRASSLSSAAAARAIPSPSPADDSSPPPSPPPPPLLPCFRGSSPPVGSV